MSKVIDLTFTVQEHWRWLVKVYPHKTFHPNAKHSFMDYNLHGFTHVDSFLHFFPGKPSIEQVPMDKFMGEATVVGSNPLKETVTVEMDSEATVELPLADVSY